MTDVEVIYTRVALRELRKLDKQVAGRIVNKVRHYADSGDPLAEAKSLTGRLAGKYRYRIGDYRAIFMADGKKRIMLLTILSVKHRKDIYR